MQVMTYRGAGGLCSKEAVRRPADLWAPGGGHRMAVLGRIGGWLNQRPYVLVLLTYFMWALNIIAGRLAAGHVPPLALTMGRWVLAVAILLPFAWPYLKRDWPVIRANLPIVFALGFAGTTGYALAAYWGLQYTEAINGLLIQC